MSRVKVHVCDFVHVLIFLCSLTQHAALNELLANIPTHCPLLQTPLAWTQEARGGIEYCPHSPSVDRINNALGYVKGNVWIVSRRANTIKNDATLDELDMIVRNLRARIAINLQERIE